MKKYFNGEVKLGNIENIIVRYSKNIAYFIGVFLTIMPSIRFFLILSFFKLVDQSINTG